MYQHITFVVVVVFICFGISCDAKIATKAGSMVPKEYHLYPSRVNWTEAVKQCEDKGMELVKILTKEQNDQIISSIKEAGQGSIGFWTSGNIINTTDTYYWGNNTKVTFTDWESGKPDGLIINGEEEKCIEIKGFKILKWNDNFCSHGLYYICETEP